ncbi:hypothetical protein TWF506_005444 [Arthrobotrys conoides]|uniref:PD-(D/E)XK nuclease-like domain-containing protein n=1 Tax=Arthrobotrys conoides TaxID=74498 RepID=A0AAN8NE75_9PEZI
MAPADTVYPSLDPSDGRVVAWLKNIGKNDSFRRDNYSVLAPQQPKSPPSTTISISHQSEELDTCPTNSDTKERKQLEEDIAPDADEELRLEAQKKHHYVQYPPTMLYRDLNLETSESVRPVDSVSQFERAVQATRSFSSESSNTTTATTWKKKRELLDRCLPRFEFLGVSGQGGLNPDDEEDEQEILSGFETLVHTFRASMALRGSICTCVEERIRGRRKSEWWEEGAFSDYESNHQRHLDETNFVIQSAARAEGLQLSISEKADWAGHAIEILRFVAGVIDSFHPVTISSITTVDIHYNFSPTVQLDLQPRHTLPTEMQRGDAMTREPLREVISARADISVNIRRKGKQTKDILSIIQTTFGEFPSPFKTIATSPLFAVVVKCQDSSTLEAEFQAVVSANAILESWRQLGTPTAYTPPPEKPDPKNLGYPTVGSTEAFGVDHVISLQVVSFSWFYSIVFTGSTNYSDQESRKVLGPFPIGDSRQFTGMYSILRFLEILFTYKVSVWLPGMIQRGRQ